jgi:hypothetical protein
MIYIHLGGTYENPFGLTLTPSSWFITYPLRACAPYKPMPLLPPFSTGSVANSAKHFPARST